MPGPEEAINLALQGSDDWLQTILYSLSDSWCHLILDQTQTAMTQPTDRHQTAIDLENFSLQRINKSTFTTQ
jgi:hypothetical protein